MDRLIPIIHKLQFIFEETNIPFRVDLPQIVVVGGQSSGKSSVLESIVGRDFLPRGTEIVTRRPIIIQLVNTPSSTEDRIEFAHKPDFTFTDYWKAREEIQLETDRVCGRNQGISSEPILMKIMSKSVVNLTLVDLPGLTQISVGDQNKDISRQIKDLCYQFTAPKTAIIMAVIPANADLSTSEALKMAALVDPTFERTIGVLTKVDLMDQGTNILDIITGNSGRPLKLGYTGVVCRS